MDVFHFSVGANAAREEVRKRAGSWFDPELAKAFESAAARRGFWETLAGDGTAAAVQALEPARHWIALDEDYLDEIAAAFGEVVDAKSHFTAGHSMRVGHYADLVAAELQLSDERRRWLRRGALLHDVGKLGVSNAILDKAGSLDGDEWEAVKRHATYTEQILGRIRQFSTLARVAAAHHERLDGSGYPDGLRGDAIPLSAQIVSIVDTFDAITTTRPYRAARSIDQARDELLSDVRAGKLNPELVTEFLRLLEEGVAGELGDLTTGGSARQDGS